MLFFNFQIKSFNYCNEKLKYYFIASIHVKSLSFTTFPRDHQSHSFFLYPQTTFFLCVEHLYVVHFSDISLISCEIHHYQFLLVRYFGDQFTLLNNSYIQLVITLVNILWMIKRLFFLHKHSKLDWFFNFKNTVYTFIVKPINLKYHFVNEKTKKRTLCPLYLYFLVYKPLIYFDSLCLVFIKIK